MLYTQKKQNFFLSLHFVLFFLGLLGTSTVSYSAVGKPMFDCVPKRKPYMNLITQNSDPDQVAIDITTEIAYDSFQIVLPKNRGSDSINPIVYKGETIGLFVIKNKIDFKDEVDHSNLVAYIAGPPEILNFGMKYPILGFATLSRQPISPKDGGSKHDLSQFEVSGRLNGYGLQVICGLK